MLRRLTTWLSTPNKRDSEGTKYQHFDLSNDGHCYFEVPDEILLEIFRWLSLRDLASVSRVCRRWNTVSSSNSLWRAKFVAEWGNERALEAASQAVNVEGSSIDDVRWKTLYYERVTLVEAPTDDILLETLQSLSSGLIKDVRIHLTGDMYAVPKTFTLDPYTHLEIYSEKQSLVSLGWRGPLLRIQKGASVVLTGVQFRHGAGGVYGGVVNNRGHAVIENCLFERNRASSGGGAIANAGSCVLAKCVMMLNISQDGGAVCNTAGTLFVAGCCFESNHAGRGGAICVTGGKVEVMQGTEFRKNGANKDGGAISLHDGHLSSNDSRFSMNTLSDAFEEIPVSVGKKARRTFAAEQFAASNSFASSEENNMS